MNNGICSSIKTQNRSNTYPYLPATLYPGGDLRLQAGLARMIFAHGVKQPIIPCTAEVHNDSVWKFHCYPTDRHEQQ